MFHEGKDENDYFEAFLNFDPQRGEVWLNEKDEGYRQAMLSVLAVE